MRKKESHGMHKTREYAAWAAMKQRCLNPKSPEYHRYGARGIMVCERWIDSFVAFLEDMGQSPPGFSIDRIDFNGNYSPENCRWADAETQSNNTRRNTFYIIDGIRDTLANHLKRTGLHKQTVLGRIKKGLTPEMAFYQGRYKPVSFDKQFK